MSFARFIQLVYPDPSAPLPEACFALRRDRSCTSASEMSHFVVVQKSLKGASSD